MIPNKSSQISIFFIAFLLFFHTCVFASPSTAKLAHNPQWRALLHYHGSLLSSTKSLADDSKFFLSKQGKYQPLSELKQHLKQKNDPKLRCRFVARYYWLSQQANFQFDPFSECADFAKWYKSLDPAGLSLIFPSVYINNPASAFGHTFLRIDSNSRDDLTAYSANYAAATKGENALFYALKGIFGGYQGFFNIAPYYQMVKKYSNLENRDIWEYPLNFSNEEVKLLVMHLWELRKIAFDYYYFDENCSYHLLSLFDVARPSLQMVEKFSGYVLPSETLRGLASSGSLAGKGKYRPSTLAVLRNRVEQSSSSEAQAAKKVVEQHDLKVLNPSKKSSTERATILELSQDYLAYLANKGKISEQAGEEFAYELLIERSKETSAREFKKLEGEDPLSGHNSFRVSAAAGTSNGKGYYEIGARPVYHSLSDPLEANTIGSQLELGDFSVRQFHEHKLQLQHFDIIDIYSLVPRDDFVSPLSWRLKIGSERKVALDNELLSSARVNFGYTYGKHDWLVYALLGPNMGYSDGFAHDRYQLNAELTSGLIYYRSNYQLQLSASYLEPLAGAEENSAQITLSPAYNLTSNQQVRLELNYDYLNSNYQREGKLLYAFFF